MTTLESKVAVSSHCNDILSARLERNERHTLKTAQYTKNRQIEVHKVPDDIEKEDLPGKIAGALSLTGIDVTTADFDKCHRIRAKPDSVVVEFHKRGIRDDIIDNRTQLKGKNKLMHDLGFVRKGIVITESLCDGYEILDKILHKLMFKGEIKDKWFWKGHLFLKANSGKVTVVKHVHDIYEGVTNIAIVNELHLESFNRQQ